MSKLTVLDLFSGIGGFSLGLERTGGFETIQFCEIDPFCRKVLAKHWPDVPCHDDITTMEFKEGQADVITGGFPCQDISFAGAGAGLAGERSGLWRELLRAIRVVRPRYAILENVAALLARGLGDVLGDLAEIGYDAEWHCIPASAVGAPHRRDRVWIVANPYGCNDFDHGRAPIVQQIPKDYESRERFRYELGANDGVTRDNTYANIRRAVHGIPDWTHRLKSLGNSVVPQIPELIGRAILEANP